MFSFPALLLACCVGASVGTRPPLLDVGDEVVIKTSEQDFFQLHCKGSKSLSWNWSSSLHENDVNIDTDKEDDSEYPFVSTLTVHNPFASDTGFYRCHYDDVTNLLTDKDNVDSTYIYVHEETVFFSTVFSTTVFTNEKLVLDCRTTLPDAVIKLSKDEKDVTTRFAWDSKIGFLGHNIAVHDSGLYKCQAESTGEMHVIHVVVKPASTQSQPPSIHKGANPHFVVGYPFTLNCTIIEENGVKLSWSYPHGSTKYVSDTVQVVEGYRNLVSTLVVKEATIQDSGGYKCTASAAPHSLSTLVNITVKEELESYVNISSINRIPVNESDVLRWKAQVFSFPQDPSIIYTNWRGEPVTQDQRIELEFKRATVSSWLRIYNVTSDDFGHYTLTATTTDGAATDNVTVSIEVKSAPKIKMIGVPDYLSPGGTLQVSCVAQGFPIPSLAWEFQSCPNGLSTCAPVKDVEIGDTPPHYPPPGNLVMSNTSVRTSSSGFLRCLANNSIDTINTTQPVTLSEIAGLHVLRHTGLNVTNDIQPGLPITVITNDDFLLLCGGNKLHHRAVTLLHTPPRSDVVVHESESAFSWLREVAVKRATKALEGKYSCQAQRYDGKIDTKTVIINVVEEAPVTFLQDSNMAKNETVTIKGNTQYYFLNCTVTGTPRPTIEWWRNDEVLSPNSSFFDGNTALLSENRQRLELKYVFKKHVGVYTCKATNRVNAVTGKLTLIVPVAGLSAGAKAGLTVALVGIAILGITVVVLFRRVKRERKFKKSFRKNALYLFEQGNVGQLNPDCSADEQAELLPYGQEWEVPRDSITLGKQLGSGAFGRVIKASVTGLEGPAATTVAIKMCKSQADPSQVHALTLELKIMIHLGKHLNIVNLMGAKTVDIGRGELWILVEYCRFGNLLVFMHRHRKNFINQIDPNTGRIDPTKVTLDTGGPLSPMSPGARSSQQRFSAPQGSPIVLSDPPHRRHQAHNPLYSATMSPTSGGVFFGPNTTPDTTLEVIESYDSEGNVIDTTNSTASSGGKVQNTYYTSTLGSTASHAPLSPTESGLVDSHGNSFVHEVGSVPGVNAPFTTTDLVCWAWQVAHGMDYLASRKVLHGDLATRNLLLADDNVVKISDFGLSREMYKKDVYMKKGDDLMPIKWISVEAIRDRIFSVQSDVWAFGVTLWEIFSLGSTPYPGIEVNKDFLQLLEDGYRMSCPKYANQEIYNLLLECWDVDPRNRPSFREAFLTLDDLMQQDVKGEYLSMNDQYMRMNKERFKEQTDYLNMLSPPEYENMTNKPNDDDLTPHYINMEVAGGNKRRDTVGQASIQSPEAVSYCNMATLAPGPTPPTNHYLPMSSKRESPSPDDDVFSPSPSDDPRFTFQRDEKNTSSAGITGKEEDAGPKNRLSETENSALIANGGQDT